MSGKGAPAAGLDKAAAGLTLSPPSGDDTVRALLGVVRELGDDDLAWLSGFAAGALAGRRAATATPAPALVAPAALTALAPAATPAASAASATVTILYGTHSGNSKKLAERAERELAAGGARTRLVRLSDFAPRELAKERWVILVVATHGDGDPAEDSRAFYDFVTSRRAPRLPELGYAVLGLGDASYPKFCHVARTLDERLAELGAQRLVARGECDVDLEPVAGPWIAATTDATLARLTRELAPEQNGVVIPLHAAAGSAPHVAAARSPNAATRDNPAAATVLVNQQLTARGADKRVLHLELALEEGRLAYETGDALAVWPRNSPALVAELCAALTLSPDEPVAHGGAELPLSQWLGDKRELTKLARPVALAVAERAGDRELAAVARGERGEAAVAELLATHQVIDLVQRTGARFSAAELVAALRPLAPRSYSIASSALAFPDEAHLTVAHVAYRNQRGEQRAGCASDYLARAGVDEIVRAYVEPNPAFRLPPPSADLLMIGPGTGVAPFRAFVQEREQIGATGKSWLFFGERTRRDTFLYQLEWQAALARGSLSRLDVAFSRDGADKVYVQHRLLEHGKEVWRWLERGAHLYVCGDAKRMAPDVEEAIVSIAKTVGGRSDDSARELLAELRAQGRYHRDVY